MPYSDNLYSSVEADSDGELYDNPDTQSSQARSSETFYPQHQRQDYAGRVSADTHMFLGGEAPEDDDEDVMAPSDGYFGGDSNSSAAPTSANVPHVPNVWVTDPSLRENTAESKAREAQEESEAARRTPSNTYPSSENASARGRHTVASSDSASLTSTGPALSRLYTQPIERTSHSYAYPGSTYAPSDHPYHPPGSSALSSVSEATHHRASSVVYTPPATPSYRSHTPRRPSQGTSRAFTPIPSDAPPAYTPSLTSPTSPTSPSANARHYSTFASAPRLPGIMGQGETQGLLAGDPESMARPDEHQEVTPAWAEGAKKRLPKWSRTCRNIVIVLILLAVAAGFIGSLVTAVKEEKDKHNVQDPSRKEPSMNYPNFDNKDGLSWGAGSVCKGGQIHRPTLWFDLSFGAEQELFVKQDVQPDSSGKIIEISGDVIFRRTNADRPEPSVSIEILVNDDRIDVGTTWDSDTQRLVVKARRHVPWDEDSSRPCVMIRITAWVPENSVLKSLTVETIHLNTLLLDNLSLSVGKGTKLSTTTGDVSAATDGSRHKELRFRGAPSSFVFNARYVEVYTISGDIDGSFPLYDYLTLQSISGDIRASVEPKELLSEAPKPAELYIKTISGDVNIYEPIDNAKAAYATQTQAQVMLPASEGPEKHIPPRDYRVNFQSTSGRLHAAVAFSTVCRFHTYSGGTKLNVLPILDSSMAETGAKKVDLETSSTSGDLMVDLADPFWIDSTSNRYTSPNAPQPEGLEKERSDEPLIPIPIPIGKVGNGDPYGMLPQVGNSNGQNGPTVTSRQVVDAIGEAATVPPWRNLRSSHTATSADITLHYPGSWEGTIDLSTMSGTISLSGKDVHVTKYGNGFPGTRRKEVHAIKGSEKGGELVSKATSGDIRVWIGQE